MNLGRRAMRTFACWLGALSAGLLPQFAQSALVSIYVMPTEIPVEAAQQASLWNSMLDRAPSTRSKKEWKQLAVLSAARAGESPTNQERLAQAQRVVADALKAFPGDAEIAAASGSLSCMRAADPSLQGMLAASYSRQGFRRLDEAVLLDERELGARLQRAITSLRAPAFLNKAAVAKRDFEYLLTKVPETDAYRPLRAMLRFHLGEAYMAVGDRDAAIESWRRVMRDQVAVWSVRAKEKLR